MTLRHGPRELAHMRHLGLIADPAKEANGLGASVARGAATIGGTQAGEASAKSKGEVLLP